MSSSEDSSSEEESILNNLSKTRQLWSSKAEISTPNALLPKPSEGSTSSPIKPRYSSTSDSQPTEVVKADEQVIEDYELPDIASMKSQFESRGSSVPLPMPSGASVKTPAKTRTTSEPSAPPPVPVNREEVEEEAYEVELGKLKAQFESAASNASTPQTKPVERSVSRSSIKQHVSKNPANNLSGKDGSKVVKKTRFEDEIAAQAISGTSEPRAQSENVAVDLSGLKSQFESRKDEHVLSPVRPTSATKTKSRWSIHRTSETDGPAPEVVRPDDAPVEEHYEVELGAIKRRFEKIDQNPSPASNTTKITFVTKKEETIDREAAPVEQGPQHDAEVVKSYEPHYDEMIGEESVKDRLARFKSLQESSRQETTIVRRVSQKKAKSPVRKEPEAENASEPASVNHSSAENLEIVRSPPAGSKITPDYVPSVDLRQTKALFEQESPKPVARKTSFKQRSSLSSDAQSPPPRVGRSPEVEADRRSHSRHSSSRSSRSKSPGSSAARRDLARSPSVRSSNFDSDSEMSDVVKPPPAGTKETPDYVPSVKLSSVKNMFESPQATAPSPTSGPRPRRSVKRTEWVNGNDNEARAQSDDTKVVAEGSYEDREGIVRPPTAGTKERPAYSLGSDFLKSRAAMFDAPKEQSYTPRNKIKVQAKPKTADVANRADEKEHVDFTPSHNLKDTKKMFEGGTAVAPSKHEPVKGNTEIVSTPQGEVVRPPPAGTRDESDIVRASNLGSVKKMFEGGVEPEQASTHERKQPIDIRQEAAEAVQRDQEVRATSHDAAAEETPKEETKEDAGAESESETEGEYVLDKDVTAQQAAEQVEQQEQQEEEEEAAAVAPVRVAVPDSPPPEEPTKEEELEPQIEEAAEEYQATDQQQQEEEREAESREVAAADVIIEDHLLRTEDQQPQADEIAAADSGIIIDDHLLRSEAQEDNGVDEEDHQQELEQQQKTSDAQDSFGAGHHDARGEDDQDDRPGKDDTPPPPAKEQVIAENGGLNIVQETGKAHLLTGASFDSVDSDYDKPHFNYPFDEDVKDDGNLNGSLLDGFASFQPSLAPGQQPVDLLNGFDNFDPIPQVTAVQVNDVPVISDVSLVDAPVVAPKGSATQANNAPLIADVLLADTPAVAPKSSATQVNNSPLIADVLLADTPALDPKTAADSQVNNSPLISDALLADTPAVVPKASDVQPPSDPFDIFNAPPPANAEQAAAPDPFDIFAPPPAQNAEQAASKDPFDLFM